MRVRQIKKIDNTKTVFNITDTNKLAIAGVELLVIAKNNTFFQGKTDENGEVTFTDLPVKEYSVFIAHPDYPAYVIDGYIPTKDLEVTLQKLQHVGSVIVSNGTGHIPGLDGRLNPILDTSDRTYLYANNIAIAGGKSQPVTFVVGEPITLEDRNGTVASVTIVRIQGRSSLLQYQVRSTNEAIKNGKATSSGLEVHTIAPVPEDSQVVDLTVHNRSMGTIERLTHNPTVAYVFGGIILALILYLIYILSGINLNNPVKQEVQHEIMNMQSTHANQTETILVNGSNYNDGFKVEVPRGNSSTCVWTWVAGTGSIPGSETTHSVSDNQNIHTFSAGLFNGRDFSVGCTNDYGEYFQGSFNKVTEDNV